MQIFDCDQGSPEWFRLRAGIPTASEFATVRASGRGGGDSKTRRTYMLKLAGEIITGEPSEGYSNAHMDRGKELEAEARELYEFMADTDVIPVGFIRDDAWRAGCSPDGLVGNNGAVEIKTALPHILIDRILRGEIPPEHKAQCQGNLWLAQRDWIDVCIYWRRIPLFKKRAFRDEPYIAELAAEVKRFNEELLETVERVRRLGADVTSEAA